MEVTVNIPDGKYCGDCILLEAGCSAAYDYCRLHPEDELNYDEGVGEHLKHPDCPSLKEKIDDTVSRKTELL